MATNRILTTAQARAVYSAMCALNQVGGGQVEAYVDAAFALVREHLSGCVRVVSIRENDKREEYAYQAAFAAAYGLPVAAPDLVAALRVAYSDIQRLHGHTVDMLGRIEAAIEQATA